MAQSSTQRVDATEEPQFSSIPGKRPVDKFHEGPVHVSIFENASSRGSFRTASFELRYKDKQEQWQTGHSYTASDLKHLAVAAVEAGSRIDKWQQENKAKQGQSR